MHQILQNGLIPVILGPSPEFGALCTLLIVLTAVCAVSGYLLGSINSAIILSRIVYRDDIRRHGSTNAGMTNVLRTYGKGAALITLAGDVLKTALAILIGGCLLGFGYVHGVSLGYNATGLGPYIAGFFAILGHVFPLYYHFKGGKGVLATATFGLILTPVPFLFVLAVFIGVVWISRYVSLGSVTASVLYPVVLYGYFSILFGKNSLPGLIAFLSMAIAALIVWCHRSNLRRISEHTENKLHFGKKEPPDGGYNPS